MIAYKGFDENLKCRGFEYEIGKSYKMPDEDVSVCMRGFHSCENPFDVLEHYSFQDNNRFCRVEASGKIDRDELNSKVASSRIFIEAELNWKDFIDEMVDYSLTGGFDSELSEYYQNRSKINVLSPSREVSSGGDRAQISSHLPCSNIFSSGKHSIIASNGEWARITFSGDYSIIASNGAGAILNASGDGSNIVSNGGHSIITSNGSCSRITSTGAESVVSCLGIYSVARAEEGSWLTLSEWKSRDRSVHPVHIKTEYVDGARIKANVWYALKDGEFVAV